MSGKKFSKFSDRILSKFTDFDAVEANHKNFFLPFKLVSNGNVLRNNVNSFCQKFKERKRHKTSFFSSQGQTFHVTL